MPPPRIKTSWMLRPALDALEKLTSQNCLVASSRGLLVVPFPSLSEAQVKQHKIGSQKANPPWNRTWLESPLEALRHSLRAALRRLLHCHGLWGLYCRKHLVGCSVVGQCTGRCTELLVLKKLNELMEKTSTFLFVRSISTWTIDEKRSTWSTLYCSTISLRALWRTDIIDILLQADLCVGFPF